MTEDQSLEFLKQKPELSGNVALMKSIYSLVGGRLALMNDVITDIETLSLYRTYFHIYISLFSFF